MVGDVKQLFDARENHVVLDGALGLEELKDVRTRIVIRPRTMASCDASHIIFSNVFADEVAMSGSLVLPITLSINSEGSQCADIGAMQEVAEQLKMSAVETKVRMTSVSPNLEYKSSHPSASAQVSLLAVSGLVDMATSVRHNCLFCAVPIVDENAALNHSAFHLLCTPDLFSSSSAEPCPLCLGGSCEAFLFKNSSSALQPRI